MIDFATFDALWDMYSAVVTNENEEHFKGLNTVDIRHIFKNLGLKNPSKEDYGELDTNGDDYVSKPEFMKFVVKMSKKQSADFGKNKEPLPMKQFKKPTPSSTGGAAAEVVPKKPDPKKTAPKKKAPKKKKRAPLQATRVLEVFDQYATEIEQEGGDPVFGMMEKQYGEASQALGFHPRNSDFDGLDANGDGFLTRGEFMKFAVRMSKRTSAEEQEAEDSMFIEESL